MNRLHFVAVGLAACCLTTPSRSEDAPKGDASKVPFFERMLKEFDKDGDGKLNEEERATARRMTEQFFGRLNEKGGSPDGRPVPPEALKRFDKDGDGKLNEEERASAMKGRDGQMKKGPPGGFDLNNPSEFVVKRFDKDGDGKLSDEEKAAAMKERDGQMKKGRPGGFDLNNPPEFVVKRFDKDGDGKLSDDEKKAAVEAIAKMTGGPGGFPSREEMIKRFDKDGDGKLSDTEEAAAKAEFAKRRGGGGGAGGGLTPGEGKPQEPKLDNAELLKKYDKDGDGKLSDDEKAAAREAFQKRDKGN